MASICAKCGAEVSSDNQTCLACGAPVATAIPVAPAAAYTPVVVAAQPAPPPAKSGSSVVKIILIVVLIFVGLGVLAAGAVGFWVWRIAHAVHVSGPNGQVSISTPGGTITTSPDETYTANDLGTDIYPGATVAKGGMKMTMPTGSSVTAIFTTSDSKDQVVSFYKSKFGSDATSMDFGPSAILTVKKGNDEQITVTVTSNSSEYGGKTQIVISHTVVTKSS